MGRSRLVVAGPQQVVDAVDGGSDVLDRDGPLVHVPVDRLAGSRLNGATSRPAATAGTAICDEYAW